MKQTSITAVLAATGAVFLSFSAQAAEWLIGNVAIVEDYRAFDPASGILITLSNKSDYGVSGTALSVCTGRFRVVVGQEGMTAEVQKNIFALVLAARATGDKVRLYVNPQNVYPGSICTVQIASLGDV